MFGKSCLGMQIGGVGDLWLCGTKVGRLMAVSTIYYPSVDAFGMEIIAYWPSVPYVPKETTSETEAAG
jgi:hypothetical protein